MINHEINLDRKEGTLRHVLGMLETDLRFIRRHCTGQHDDGVLAYCEHGAHRGALKTALMLMGARREGEEERERRETSIGMRRQMRRDV